MRKVILLFIMAAAVFAAFVQDVSSCTVFRMTAKDGNITIARSMEFGVDLKYDIIVVPVNMTFESPTLFQTAGLKWTTKYGYTAVASMGLNYGVSEGMNEKGLSISALWYESTTKYQTVTKEESSKALAHIMYSDWILGNFSTVDEVKEATKNIKVFGYTDSDKLKSLVTLHFIVYDDKGGCIVVEYDNGQCNIYDNPLGIMTNAPSLPWQLTNLRQYVGLENFNPITIKKDGFTVSPTGHGDGMFGIPGDYTPPSRFVRLAMFERFVNRQDDKEGNLNLCQQIINTFTIPFGIIVDQDAQGNVTASESTQWVTFRDVTNKIMYFKTYENQNLRMLDLNRLDYKAKDIRRINMYGVKEIITDITE